MRKLETADAGVKPWALQEKTTRSEEARYARRLHGRLLIGSGRSCNEVGVLFGWGGGPSGDGRADASHSATRACRAAERTGRPRSLDDRSRRRIEADLRRSPDDFGLTFGFS